MFRISALLFLGLFFFSFQAFAQSGIIRGFVYDKKTGEPMPYVNVVLKKETFGATTNFEGFFNITKVPTGKHTLQCTFLGYDTVEIPIDIVGNSIINKKIYLTSNAINLGPFIVDGIRAKKEQTVKISTLSVTPKDIKKMPAVAGEPDIAQYLQVIPGVVFTGDQGGQLYIRGGAPIQNKVLIDGMIIYNPFHSIGLFSVFDTDIVRNIDVLTGGFNSEHGGRISAVMDITTKDGSQKRLKGKVSASPFMSKLLLEGPFKKPTESKNSPTFIISGKTSYLEQTSKFLYPYANEQGVLPYNFTDLYAKASFKAEAGSKVNLFGFKFDDRVNFSDVNLRWDSFGLGTNFILIPAASSTLIKGNIAFSDYKINQIEADGSPRRSRINGFNVGLNFNYFLGDKDEITYGFDILGFRTEFEFTNQADIIIEQNQNTTELASFVKYRKITKKLVFEPGLRLHYYASLANFSFEPRFGFKYNISKKLRFKMAGGLYSQNLLSAVSDRDVVNLFYGFLSGPDNLQREFNGNPVTHRLQKAQHGIAGFEIDLGKYLELNLEGYIKNFSQLTNVNRNKIFDERQGDKPELLRRDYIIENGRATGFDISAKYQRKKIYLWGTYSLTYVTRFDGFQRYRPHFDRRHNVNLLGTYTFGKDYSWEASVRWNLGSGFPFTQTQGFYEKTQLGGVSDDYLNQNGELGIIYGELNTGRLPYYHRLDASIKKRYDLSDNASLDINFGISNLYNRENIFYFDRIRFTRVNQLPILPSLSLALNF